MLYGPLFVILKQATVKIILSAHRHRFCSYLQPHTIQLASLSLAVNTQLAVTPFGGSLKHISTLLADAMSLGKFGKLDLAALLKSHHSTALILLYRNVKCICSA